MNFPVTRNTYRNNPPLTLPSFMVSLPTKGSDSSKPTRKSKELDKKKVETWQEWLLRNFPHVCTHPFAKRHIALWEWIEKLKAGGRPKDFLAIWPRGGGKSSSVEMGVNYVCDRLTRHFAVIVSETQDQADKHVGAIATLMESRGVQRAINIYGSSKGWRRQELRTATGFNCAAFGLDTGARGVKLDNYRPDWIILDDIDGLLDTLKTRDKKIEILTNTLLPAGSEDCAVLGVQNRIYQDSIFSQLADGIADFLYDREPVSEEPAILDLAYEAYQDEDGLKKWRITGGTPTWEGQSINTCQSYMNRFGEKAFLRECQNQVEGAGGYVFDTSRLLPIAPSDVPILKSVCLAWDLAATEGGGDWTVGVLMGCAYNGAFYILAIIRGQWSSERVRAAIRLTKEYYQPRYPLLTMHLPQDPGQAGKDQAGQLEKAYGQGTTIEPVSGDKTTRATGLAESVNLGNVYLVQQDLPDFLHAIRSEEVAFKPLLHDLSYRSWHAHFKAELRSFRANETDQVDDQVDGGSDAHTELTSGGTITVIRKGRTH